MMKSQVFEGGNLLTTGLPLHVKPTAGAGTADITMNFIFGTLISIELREINTRETNIDVTKLHVI